MKTKRLWVLVATGILCAGVLFNFCGDASGTMTAEEVKMLLDEGWKPQGPVLLSCEDGTQRTAVQLMAASYEPEAVQKLLEHGQSATMTTPEYPHTPLELCLKTLQYLPLGDAPEGLEYKGLAVLDVLLAHGAVPAENTHELLPCDAAMHRRVVELFEQHGHYIMAGENPYNACCVPE